jgi:hypothetical protein
MTSKPDKSGFATALRQRAEARVQERTTNPWPDPTVLDNISSPERLFHEL